MEFHVDIDGAVKGLQSVKDKFFRGTALYGETAALKMEAYAKAHAPWENRTHNARNTLKGFSGWGQVGRNIQTDMLLSERAGEYGDIRTKGGQRYAELHPVTAPPALDDYDSSFVIGVSGNMNYSPYLEYAHGQAYAILRPTINTLAPEVIRGWAAMLSRIK